MLEMFAALQASTPDDGALTCVDMSSVGQWHDDANGPELDVLLKETPARPPFKVCVVGIVTDCTNVPLPVADPRRRLIVAFVERKSEAEVVMFELGVDLMPITVGGLGLDERGCVNKRITFSRDSNDLLGPDGFTSEVIACGLAMFHVGNIGLREVQFPRAMRRRAQKDGLRGPTVYHTLRLRPFGKDDEREQRSAMPTMERPLHLVRGHFARYSEDRPLFGRYSGTFWRAEHEAGNPSVAVVRKTYAFDVQTRADHAAIPGAS
ncbi:MAG TPA: hypothetical protein VGQ44_17180 [Gemmatimonadaceae bacterium]|jgi:hypothetical protein|nr:hypothetical protein [Gemmatimonadaceae bacterium]